MTKAPGVLLIALLFFVQSNGQTVTINESSKIQGSLFDFFTKGFDGNTVKPADAKVEGFLCIIKVSEQGTIEKVNFLADEKYKGPGYFRFTKMTPKDFENWKCEKCKSITILIPVFVVLNGLQYIEETRQAAGLEGFKPGQSDRFVIIRDVNVSWPESFN
jgi:hypothetical protein